MCHVWQDFGVDSFNLDDVLQGTVRFTDVLVTSPIVAAHVSEEIKSRLAECHGVA